MVISTIDAIMPPCITVQGPRDQRLSEQLAEQLKFIDKNSTSEQISQHKLLI